jgi:hypothetical protein
MKAAKICLVILLIAIVINFARQGAGFHISRVLPGLGGDLISLYDLGGVILVCLLIHGIGRIGRNTKRDNQPKH